VGVSVRRGAGTGGSDRVTLTWADGAIRNTWLQVTVKAGTRTGLGAADVFYFGNLAGETGDSTTRALVDSADASRVTGAISSTAATVSNRYDLNHDGWVNATDATLAKSNASRSITLLTLA
jgi:hypothetical protein